MFQIPLNQSEAHLEIKKSHFLSFVYPFHDLNEVQRFLKEDKLRYKEATHHVYAFRIGTSHNYSEGYSDDGEPSGTAGKPILSFLQKKGFSNLLVVVVRYFGGTLLGAGGLVRAYSQSAKLALDKVQWEFYIPKVSLRLFFSYPFYNLIKREMYLFGAILLKESFDNIISIEIDISKENEFLFLNRLNDLSKGSLHKRDDYYEIL